MVKNGPHCSSLSSSCFSFFSLAQIRLVRGEFVDESGCPVPDWIGLIRAARNSQEQNLEALSDLPGGQVNILSP